MFPRNLVGCSGLLSLLLVLAATLSGVCQDAASAVVADAELVEIAAREVDAQRLPGLILGYFAGGQPGHIGAAGVRQIGSNDPLEIDDLVHIGSCTKACTALVAALAVEEGKLRWDSTLAEVLPDLTANIDPQYTSVTLQQLLNHRGNLVPNVSYPRIGEDEDPREARRRAIIAGLKYPPATPKKPGTEFKYSNLGYILVGHMLEEVYGQSWESLVREHLFTPLGISENEAGFGPPRTAESADQPAGHRRNRDGDPVVWNIDNSPVLGPAGRVHCSLPAWAKCCAAHVHSRSAGGLLNEETLQALHTDAAGHHYAGGWILIDRPELGGAAWTHTGSNTVWTATAIVSPLHDCVYMAATNISDEDSAQLTLRLLKELVQLRAARQQ